MRIIFKKKKKTSFNPSTAKSSAHGFPPPVGFGGLQIRLCRRRTGTKFSPLFDGFEIDLVRGVVI